MAVSPRRAGGRGGTAPEVVLAYAGPWSWERPTSRRNHRRLNNVTSNVSGGAGDMFLMVKGAKHGLIKGESQDDKHKGEIDVLSWSWGMQRRPHRWGHRHGEGHDQRSENREEGRQRFDGLDAPLRTNERSRKPC